jgi:hypothetical protein
MPGTVYCIAIFQLALAGSYVVTSTENIHLY